MIQRIQSIFLFLAAGACFGLFGTDAADTAAPVAASELFADGSFTIFDDPILIGIFTLAGVLFLADIFLFRNRKLQITLSRVALFLVGLGVGYGAFSWYNDPAGAQATPDFGLAMPILSLVFAVLAVVYIKKDEKLVRSADRLR